MDLFDHLNQSGYYIQAATIYLIPLILKKATKPWGFMNNEWIVRLMPLWPVVASFISVWYLKGVEIPEDTLNARLMAVVWLSWLSSTAHKFFGQMILGDDARIKSMKFTARKAGE